MKTIYNAAIYCRLSREDENNTPQSESIKNQVDFLTRYVIERGWNITGTYTDDGYTGTNFDRPDFKRMLEDIEEGKVNLVITKDLSRLGRDYIETGRYMEKYFPEKKVRYIAVNDGIDTFEDSGSNDMSPFKSVINDLYARDISKKVRSVFKNKVISGKFIGAFAPYGYKKDPENNNRLIIDEAVAGTVRRIFRMYMEGHGLSHIAHTLNSEKTPNPSSYKAAECDYKNGRIKNFLWAHNTVKNILINPTYAGNMAQGKYRKVNYKSKKLLTLDRSSWVVIENTHDPIVSLEDFDLVQKMMRRKNNPDFSTKNPVKLFSGYVFCGDCGEYMTFASTPGGEEYLICSRYKRYTSKYCTRHAIRVSELEKAVHQDINVMVKSVVMHVDVVKESQKITVEKRRKEITDDMNGINKKLSEIISVIKSLYMDKVKGVLGEQEFLELNREFNREKEVLAYKYNQLKTSLDRQAESDKEVESTFKVINSLLNAPKLTREVLEKLVDKIEIYEDNSIKVTYKFKNPLAA